MRTAAGVTSSLTSRPGTGVFTRLLLENGNSVFAVEPNAEMRERGVRTSSKPYPRLVSVAGTAEETTLRLGFGGLRDGGAGGALVRPGSGARGIRAHSEAGGMVRVDLE
jgi:hypothetical protein